MTERQNPRGWSYPVGVDYHTGKIKMTSLKEDIRQSIFILLSTTPGERLLHHNYGCNLSQFMFEPITYELLRKIREETYMAITRFEKRIYDLQIDILNDTQEESRIVISIKYKIPALKEADEIYYAYTLK